MHNQRYTLHLAEFLWRERFLSRRFLGSSAWELPAVWLLADLIANVHHHSSMKNITGPLMRATNATELAVLRKNCFPDAPAVLNLHQNPSRHCLPQRVNRHTAEER